MMIQTLLESDSPSELESALAALASAYWQAKSCYYLKYDEHRQGLSRGDSQWELSSLHQPGHCAMTLRPSADQGLPWPDELPCKVGYRLAQPVFHWGSLTGVLCLGFDQRPEALERFSEVERAVGILGDRVAHKEQSDRFMARCMEFLVQAVEARVKDKHVDRCCKLTAKLAHMLDCSPQVRSHLMEAAQCHDIGLLSFADPTSAEALREHPRVAATLLRLRPEMTEVAALVAHHHERYDGSGTPEGKRGDELPLECWVLSLVEDFVEQWEASLSSYDSKVREFFSERAKHHHPDVVDALCGLVDSDQLKETLGEA